MSIKQMAKVFDDTSIKGNEKLLLLSMADFSNDDGVCFPSYNTLVTKTSMNKGSVSKWLNSLEEKGKLLIANRKRKNGSNSSNKYLLYPNETFDNLDEEDKEFFSQSLKVILPIQSLEVVLGDGLEVKPAGSLEVKPAYEPPLQTTTEEPPLMGVDKKAWDDWCKYRIEIKKKLTRLSKERQIAFLNDNLSTHKEIINQSIMNGWTGLFEIKNAKQNSNNNDEAWDEFLRDENNVIDAEIDT